MQELDSLARILLENGKFATPKALEMIKEKNMLDEVLKLQEIIIDENIVKNIGEKEIVIEKNKEKKISEEYEIDFKIKNAEIKHGERKTSDFIYYFNSRYFLIQQMLLKRINPISIANLKKNEKR